MAEANWPEIIESMLHVNSCIANNMARGIGCQGHVSRQRSLVRKILRGLLGRRPTEEEVNAAIGG